MITAHLADAPGTTGWKIPGRVFTWELITIDDATGLPIDGMGSLDTLTSTTDLAGLAKVTLTSGSATGVSYFVYAKTPAL